MPGTDGAIDTATMGARGIRRLVGCARTRCKTEVERGGHGVSGTVPRPRPAHLQQRSISSKTGARTTSETQRRPTTADSAKKGFRWKRTRRSQQHQQDPEQQRLKQADLDTLELAAQEGHIDLKYLDEAGFCLFSPVSYSYSRVNQQKRLEQVPTRGSRISILGLWQPAQQFEYALAQGGFDGESYLKVMDWIAQKASRTLEQTGRLTVVVQDNGSIHKREIVRQQWQRWQDQGLLSFFLPPYSAQMNRIEDQWHQLKAHEIAGQMFEDEYDLALAVIKGMETRSEAGGYPLERFKFNSA